jgi:hypothetical protein
VVGWYDGGLPATGNRIGGSSRGDRNIVMGRGFRNSQGIPAGFAVQLFDTAETVVENNMIGTSTNGMSQGNSLTTIGISFDSHNDNVIIRNNQISGIQATALPLHGPSYKIGVGVYVGGTGSNVALIRNRIGLNALGQPTLGAVTGVWVDDYYQGPVQGISITSRNVIAGHLDTGVLVGRSLNGVSILSNMIYGNGNLGIDLIDELANRGVSPNDLGDGDSGANGLQNFPVIDSAESTQGSLTIHGSLQSTASTPVEIEFFASPAPGTSGYGEGRNFLKSIRGQTDANGEFTFNSTVRSGLAYQQGWVVTATATNRNTGSTSEFSAARDIDIGP